MAGTTRRRSEAASKLEVPARRSWVYRFDKVERAVHWVNAVLFIVLVLTGLALYSQPIAVLVGRRSLIAHVHLYCGLALPIPLLVGIIGYWGKGLRRDLGRLNRFLAADRSWFRSWLRRREHSFPAVMRGKFNPGQKLNAAWTGGVIVVMILTGVVMYWGYLFTPVGWRTGATFVHDWVALFVVIAIVGHVYMSLRDRESLRSMIHGKVTRGWATRHAGAWLEEVDRDPGSAEPESVLSSDRNRSRPP